MVQMPDGARQGETDCIVTCHNYGRFLAQCLDSCLQQTLPFRYIIVVDDASDDDTHEVARRYEAQGVQYLRVEHGDYSQARNAGIAALPRSRFVLFVDADNWLQPDYHEALRSPMTDPQLGVTYAPLCRIYEGLDRREMFPWILPYDFDLLRVHNFADACSLIRREAFEQAGGWQDEPGGRSDWLLWLQITRLGWTMQKVETTYLHYRVHMQAMSARLFGKPEGELAVMQQGYQICIVTLFSGRTWALEHYFGWLPNLQWNRANLHLVAVDNSANPLFAARLQQELAACGLSYTYVQENRAALDGVSAPHLGQSMELRLGHPYAVNVHMARLYALARQHIPARADLIWTVEDDIEPPPDAIKPLFFGLIRDWDADVSAGIVTDRFTARALAWTGLPDVEMTQEEVAAQAPPGQTLAVYGTGFGCTLFRRAFWERLAFRPSYTWSEQYCAYDWAAAYEARQQGRKWLLCGSVRCKHWQENGRHV